tara:strand:+ start:276 stop:491 length:216 start_codon:yes stop_codon:yes gene_type:complete
MAKSLLSALKKLNSAQKYLIFFWLFWVLGGYPLVGEAMSPARYLAVAIAVGVAIYLLRVRKSSSQPPSSGS